MISRDQIVSVLENIALLMELKGENPFKTRAYRTGAEVVQTYPDDIVRKAAENDLKGIKGIGDALQQKLSELATTGKLEFYEKLRAEFPESIFELFEIQGLGPKKIKALYDNFGVGSVADLKRVCESGDVAALAGFGQKSVDKILEAIEYREKHASLFRLGDVAPDVEQLMELLKSHPDATQVSTAGSFRRGKETLHDLDFLVATSNPSGVMDLFVSQDFVETVLVHGSTKSSVRLKNGVQCDLRAVTTAEYPFALNYFTGRKEHNVAMRSRAAPCGTPPSHR